MGYFVFVFISVIIIFGLDGLVYRHAMLAGKGGDQTAGAQAAQVYAPALHLGKDDRQRTLRIHLQ
jgi:hypothetical protein